MLKRTLEKIQFTERNLPLAIIVAGILAFGLQLPSLGFFQDDWQHVHYWNSRGAIGMLEFLTMDGRPTAIWCYTLLFPLLGSSPLNWQLFTLVLHLLTTIVFIKIFQILWPEHKFRSLLFGFFLLLYPFFTLQFLAVAYAIHWTSFALFALSLLWMLHAIQNPKRYLLYTTLAITATTLQLFTVEYFVGLELLRPLAAWMMIQRESRLERTKRVALIWTPYLLILILFFTWRTVILGSLGLRNNPMDAFSFQTILVTLQNLGADAVLVLISSWFKLIDPIALELNRARNFIVLAITFVSALLAYLYSRFISDSADQSPITNYQLPHHQPLTPNSYLLSGILALLLGLGPAYAANFILHLKLEPWNGRFALAALPGAAMILSLVFESIFTSAQTRRVMFAILIGLLIGYHNRVAFDFKAAWEKQVNLYQQLTWRAPSIEPGTAIITDQEILSYMGDYPTSFALNMIYDAKSLRPSSYWFFAMSENLGTDADSLANGVELKARKYASTFVGDSRDSLIIVFEPEKNQCLWILRPEDAAYRVMPEQIKIAAQVSNLSRIHDQPQTDFVLFKTIVPAERGSWCFHYQSADLARQMGDWKQVIFFWNLAKQGGYSPGHGFEYIPFIQAYAHEGDWATAFALTKQSNRVSANMKTILCPVWEGLNTEIPLSAERDSAFSEAMELLGCQ